MGGPRLVLVSQLDTKVLTVGMFQLVGDGFSLFYCSKLSTNITKIVWVINTTTRRFIHFYLGLNTVKYIYTFGKSCSTVVKSIKIVQ